MANLRDFVEIKNPLLSRGVMGGAGALLLGLLQFAGFGVAEGDVVELQQHIAGLLTSLAGIIAIWGRIRASKRIGFGGE